MNDSCELDAALDGSENDLDLLAFCYLTDDLSPALKEAFELRLATEQPAREALARAVELSVALKQTSPVELNRAVSSFSHSSPATLQPRAFDLWVRAMSYLAIASAACLAVVIGARAIWQNQTAQLPETAFAWSQVRDSWAESAATEAFESAANAGESALATEGELEQLAAEQGEEEAASEMPAWLLTAVAGPNDLEAANEEALVPEKSTE